MALSNFEDLIVWQKAHQLTLMVYKLTNNYPETEEFCLISQNRRCAISVPSNIAEGFRRRSQKDSNHFYVIAQGSLEELRYQILLARDLKYIDEEEYQQAIELANEVGKLLNGWIKSLKQPPPPKILNLTSYNLKSNKL